MIKIFYNENTKWLNNYIEKKLYNEKNEKKIYMKMKWQKYYIILIIWYENIMIKKLNNEEWNNKRIMNYIMKR